MTVVALPTTPLVQNESDLRRRLAAAIGQVNALVLGKDKQVRLAFACVLAGGTCCWKTFPARERPSWHGPWPG